MNAETKKTLELVINSLVNEDSKGATNAFHDYLRAKTQSILMNEKVEQLDELSREAMINYSRSAEKNVEAGQQGVNYQRQQIAARQANPEEFDKYDRNPLTDDERADRIAANQRGIAKRSAGLAISDKRKGLPQGVSSEQRSRADNDYIQQKQKLANQKYAANNYNNV